MPRYLDDGRYVDIPEFWRDPVHRAGFIEPEENATSHKGAKKVETVMREFKHGTLHSGSGAKVTSRAQAIAIAMHEAGLARKRKR